MPTKSHGYCDDHYAILSGGYTLDPYTGLWYMWNEILPQPQESPQNLSLRVEVKFNIDNDEDFEKQIHEMKDEGYVAIIYRFHIGDKIFEMRTDSYYSWIEFAQMRKEVKEGKHSHIGPLEFGFYNFHAWNLLDGNYRFALQNGEESSNFGKLDSKLTKNNEIHPFEYIFDVIISQKYLFNLLSKLLDETFNLMNQVYSPEKCPALKFELTKPTAVIMCKDGGSYNYYPPKNWIDNNCMANYEQFIFPHVQKHACPPQEEGFEASISLFSGNYLLAIRHKHVSIRLYMAGWTYWEDDLYDWLILLLKGEWPSGGVCFNTEGIDAVFHATMDTYWAEKNPDADENLFKLLIWSNGTWFPDFPKKGKEHKKRAIHVKIERTKLIRIFYDILKSVLDDYGGILEPMAGDSKPRRILDLSPIEKYLGLQ